MRGEAVVGELEVGGGLVRGEEQVLRLHVAMADTLAVAVRERLKQVVRHLGGKLLRVRGLRGEPIGQLATQAQLLRRIDVGVVLPPAVEAQHVPMPVGRKFLQDAHLPIRSSSMHAVVK